MKLQTLLKTILFATFLSLGAYGIVFAQAGISVDTEAEVTLDADMSADTDMDDMGNEEVMDDDMSDDMDDTGMAEDDEMSDTEAEGDDMDEEMNSIVMAAQEIRAQIALLRGEHASLKAQVEAGTITKAEAQEMWLAKIEALRMLKEELFAEKMTMIRERHAMILEQNGERAEAVKEFMENMAAQRESVMQEKQDIHAAVEAGEITKVEARMQIHSVNEQARAAREGFREEFMSRKARIKNVLMGIHPRREMKKDQYHTEDDMDEEEMSDDMDSE